MNIHEMYYLWIGAGIVFMLLELIMPGLIVIFLGIGAILIGIFIKIGIINGWLAAFTWWFIISLFLIIILRQLLMKLFPSESIYQLTEEDVEAIGKVVEVVETVTESEPTGRIKYAGTTWPAISKSGTIPKGSQARLLYRDNIAWVVESVDII